MTTQSQYNDLSEFLAKHNAKADKTISPTHTRIGDKNLNIFGGSYIIPQEDLASFFKLYHEAIFVKKKVEYLTEKQTDTGAALLVDFDFRYSHDTTEKQHTIENIQDMVVLYLDELKEFFIFEAGKPFYIYIMEKPHVNRLQDGSLTKDGIHMVVGIQMNHVMQLMLRDKIIEKIQEMWELPLINNWDAVLDEGISKGTTNWQLFGSRKPGNQAYELTQQFKITYDPADGEFMMEELSIKLFDYSKNLIKLSAQNLENPKFEINPKILSEYNKRISSKSTKTKKASSSKTKIRLLNSGDDEDDDQISLEDIDCKDKLDAAMENILKDLKTNEQFVKELHQYTQILPAKYYEPGSHLLNRQVAFALKNTDERLFLSWVMLRSKSTDFDYGSIPDLYGKWKHFSNGNKSGDSITKRSILYWAKQDAYEDYMKVKKNTIDYFLDITLASPTEFDFATVLYHMFKDKYVCSSIQSKSWHVFKNHKWETDLGQSLRLAISKDMYQLYHDKIEQYLHERNNYESSDERKEEITKMVKHITEQSNRLKRTNDKNNIMREAMEIFYDRDFIKNIDANRYLMCFKNGVVDFKNKVFRDGYPQDYIAKSTNIIYTPFNQNDEYMRTTSLEILTFMEQLFPVAELNKYMWDYCASTLIGTNLNQTFNIFLGSGSNGKSRFIDLMGYALGQYKGTVPITLVSEKRNGIGGTSSEVIQLKGIRFAVMQEPSKDTKLNEGILKELTGGDPIQARALYQECETFTPQFKLSVCTNVLFNIESNDDGTWRRMKKVDFMSKFVGENETYNDDTKYIFPKDKDLEDKLPQWAQVFASMLVKRAFETNGFVADCDIVNAASNKYRQSQDHLAGFVHEMIVKTDLPIDKIKKKELQEQFKIWFQDSQGTRKMPKGAELVEYMDKKFGKAKEINKLTAWWGVRINYPGQMNELDAVEEDD